MKDGSSTLIVFQKWLVYEIDDDFDELVAAPVRNLELFSPDRGLTHWSYWLCSLNRHAGHLHSLAECRLIVGFPTVVFILRHLRRLRRLGLCHSFRKRSTMTSHRSRTLHRNCNPFPHLPPLETMILHPNCTRTCKSLSRRFHVPRTYGNSHGHGDPSHRTRTIVFDSSANSTHFSLTSHSYLKINPAVYTIGGFTSYTYQRR